MNSLPVRMILHDSTNYRGNAMTAKVVNLDTYRRERAIDEAICGLIEARAEKIISEYRDVLNSKDPLYDFFMGEHHGN